MLSVPQRLKSEILAVNELHQQLAKQPQLHATFNKLRHWRGQRFEQLHADLQKDKRYQLAVHFIARDIFGAADIQLRDQQMATAFNTMIKVLPESLLNTVLLAMRLNHLSLSLDAELTQHYLAQEYALAEPVAINEAQYCQAMRQLDKAQQLQRIELIQQVGMNIDAVVRTPFVGIALKMCRAPARAANIWALQLYLERGFAAFEPLRGASIFLNMVRSRENTIIENIMLGADDFRY
ncbi:MAG: hypothetical protein H0W44_05505 [Gammaproteobacteria bacterium]|nr:hypothetical protein [Gammaproteobacteria bacterium]